MRHNKKFNHLGRTSSHRKAMLSNMASSLIESKRITTTVAKAKALRGYVEPLITKAKNDTTHSRRTVFKYLQNKNAVSELFRDVAAKVADRPGGYTRILKTGPRLGDNAEMCIIELVDFNEAMLESKEEAAKPKKRRSRRGGGTKKSKTTQPAASADAGEAGQEKPEEGTPLVEDVEPVEETDATSGPDKEEPDENTGEKKSEDTEPEVEKTGDNAPADETRGKKEAGEKKSDDTVDNEQKKDE